MNNDQASLISDIQKLTSMDFPTVRHQSHFGMSGELESRSRCGRFILTASLTPEAFDSSDEDARSAATLDIAINDLDGDPLIATEGIAYEYHGGAYGAHLLELLRSRDGGLLEMLFDSASNDKGLARASSARPR